MVGERYTEATSPSWFCSTTFVMTSNRKSARCILNSHIDFARALNSNEIAITNILNSQGTSTVMKIKSLQNEIVKALKIVNNKYTWLLIVDNVTKKLKKIATFLPDSLNLKIKTGKVVKC